MILHKESDKIHKIKYKIERVLEWFNIYSIPQFQYKT